MARRFSNIAFAKRHIGADLLPKVDSAPLPLDEKAAPIVSPGGGDQFGKVAPGLVQYTTDYLFRDLWLRPDLAPRERSLVVVAAPITSGQIEQITYYLNRAMDKGLSEEQATEAITHLPFYAGWPNAMSALSVAKAIFGVGAAYRSANRPDRAYELGSRFLQSFRLAAVVWPRATFTRRDGAVSAAAVMACIDGRSRLGRVGCPRDRLAYGPSRS